MLAVAREKRAADWFVPSLSTKARVCWRFKTDYAVGALATKFRLVSAGIKRAKAPADTLETAWGLLLKNLWRVALERARPFADQAVPTQCLRTS